MQSAGLPEPSRHKRVEIKIGPVDPELYSGRDTHRFTHRHETLGNPYDGPDVTPFIYMLMCV